MVTNFTFYFYLFIHILVCVCLYMCARVCSIFSQHWMQANTLYIIIRSSYKKKRVYISIPCRNTHTHTQTCTQAQTHNQEYTGIYIFIQLQRHKYLLKNRLIYQCTIIKNESEYCSYPYHYKHTQTYTHGPVAMQSNTRIFIPGIILE